MAGQKDHLHAGFLRVFQRLTEGRVCIPVSPHLCDAVHLDHKQQNRMNSLRFSQFPQMLGLRSIFRYDYTLLRPALQ